MHFSSLIGNVQRGIPPTILPSFRSLTRYPVDPKTSIMLLIKTCDWTTTQSPEVIRDHTTSFTFRTLPFV
jgi:hypothetical protein